ncbi:MAG: Gfo/Idh/MocA family oxidoreductase [Acidobacteria bacterium]|nr:Gfo/Idh/MocA family oxidoreductase [Acidobacteriota bacterium]
MNPSNPVTRRGLLAGAASLVSAPAVLSQRSPNDRIGIAMVGVGTRGIYLLDRAQEAPNTEIRVICDLYDSNLKRALDKSFNKKAQLTKEWEKAVSSPDIDAVFIATPDFWHAPMTIRAAANKKHVYVEKALCRTLAEAKAIRQAVRDNKIVLQLGHHQNSDPYFVKAREIYRSGQLGKVALVRTYIDRTSAFPEWQFYTAYNINETPKDATPETIEWKRFVANAPQIPFDVEKFFRWRCWWEYGTGIAGDLMSHQWDGVNMIAGMGIPEAVHTMGGLYFWKGDREVPDQWHVMFEYPKKELSVTFGCTFHNRHHGTTTLFFGRDATLEVHGDRCRVYGAEWKPEYRQKLAAARKAAEPLGLVAEELVTPDYAMKRGELEVTSHMRNFIDCIRSGETPRCGLDRAWEEAVTVVMSVESHFRQQRVKWDPVNEQIV